MRLKVRQSGLKMRDGFRIKSGMTREREVKRNLPIQSMKYLIVCFGFLFSLNAFAVGDLVGCGLASQDGYDQSHILVKMYPNDISKIYNLGIEALCLRKKQEGMAHLQKASDMGHAVASHLIGLYYKTDGTLDSSSRLTKDQKNYDATIYYFERAAEQIEKDSNYPDSIVDVSHIEGQTLTSAKVFVTLPYLYYEGYNRAIGDILKTGVSYSDTFAVLTKLRDSAERCLRRPSLSVWKEKREEMGHSLKVQCQALKDFVERAFTLEQNRIAEAKNCTVPLKKCVKHQNIINQLIRLANEMWGTLNSVPLIG